MTSKIKVSSEIGYLAAIVLLSLAVAMLSAADFGISMIVAPAYLLSLNLQFLSFGQGGICDSGGAVYCPLHHSPEIPGGLSDFPSLPA